MEETTENDGVRLPGFRFHPTEEELLDFYLKRAVVGKRLNSNIIGLLNIYHHEPWDLPGLAMIGEREWYFIVPRDRKQGSGGRPNRTTEKGFWKATGSDRRIVSFSDPKRVIGLRKTLVFYRGRAPRGRKTDWIMNEFRLPDNCPLPKEMVLCKIYMKATSLKVLEQRAVLEEGSKSLNTSPSSSLSSVELLSFCNQRADISPAVAATHKVFKTELGEVLVKMEEQTKERKGSSMSLQMPPELENLSELEVHRWSHGWTQDPVWNQVASPWLQSVTPHYANIPNF